MVQQPTISKELCCSAKLRWDWVVLALLLVGLSVERGAIAETPDNDPSCGVNFLKHDNSAIDKSTEALNVSNYVTTEGLPTSSETTYATACDDKDNFRLEVTDPTASGSSVTVKLKVGAGSYDDYVLDKKSQDRFRGSFLRLVSDESDDGKSGHGNSDPDNQTIRVKLGDVVTIKYTSSSGVDCTRTLTVGRPMTDGEGNNGSNQLKHDIREVKLHIVVFRNTDGEPCVTRTRVMADIEEANQRFAQSTIRFNSDNIVIDMGGEGDPGVDLPTGPGIDWSDGFDGKTTTTGGSTPEILNAEERAVLALKDDKDDTIDIFYFDKFSDDMAYYHGPLGRSQPARYSFGNELMKNFIYLSSRNEGFTASHEIMHILLNSAHRNQDNEPATSLFKAGPPGKRIGPNPAAEEADLGNEDTTTIRTNAEALPQGED